ncbi:MAG: trigger factor [Actinomycetales bacterium]
MKSAVESLAPTRVKLVVEVPYEELKPSIDKAYRTISSQVSIPGFRRGKVPPRIIDQRVGRGAVLQEAVNDALPGLYRQAVAESDIRPLGQPELDVSEVPDPGTGEGDLRFSAEVDVRPQFDLPDMSAIAVTVDSVEVTEADVDERLDALRRRFASLSGIDRPVHGGDFVSLDLSAVIDGEEVDAASGVSYEVGSGTMLEGLDDVLLGLSADEQAIFTAPLAGGPRQGEQAEVTVTVRSVKERVLPAADDDFAQLASEFDTIDELRESLRGEAGQLKTVTQGVQARDAVLRALVDGVEIPVPPALVTEEVDRHLEGEGRQADDEHRAEVTADTERTLRGQFLLDAIAEAEDVKVRQPELVQFLVSTSRQYGMGPQEFVRAVEEAGQMPGMIAEVARRQALAIALSRATVTDSAGNAVDLEESMRRQAAGVPDVAGAPGGDGDAVFSADEADAPSGDDTAAAAAGPAVLGDDAAAVPVDEASTVVVEAR